ncbi:hypothetical protein IQ07DRAFT_601903 [Pyrenochaeta sp. DS3sAY3a]|nr:hypothetical protein IQ07DRAFT_601903 [Pyrenochaeta sp. DS3sAY3a]
MATTGSCSCGNIKWAFSGEPIVSCICHCNRCKRSNGSLCSLNLIVPAPSFRLPSGTPKAFTTQGGSGADATSHFCENCGSQLYITSSAAPGLVIIKSGTIDDVGLLEEKFKPTVEIHCDSKLGFVPNLTATSFAGQMPR